MKIFFITLSFLFIYCGHQDETSKTFQKTPVELFHPVNPAGGTIKSRVNLPSGYSRMVSEENSFAEYLQKLPLKPDGSQVHYYNGEVKSNQVHVPRTAKWPTARSLRIVPLETMRERRLPTRRRSPAQAR